MAIGKKSKDIFARTTKPANIGLEVAPRIKGRPAAEEAYQKVTVCLYNRQVIFLDKVALLIREKTGKHVNRAELIRALVARAATQNLLEAKDFEKILRVMLPTLL